MKVDLHSHTKYSSDAMCPPEKLIKKAIKKGMNAIAITDHNTTKGWKESLEKGKKHNFPIIKGEEIKVYTGKKKVGEIIGLFLNEEIKPGDPFKVIDRIKRQGGLAIIAHPYDGNRGFKSLGAYSNSVDGIEVFNSRVLKKSSNEKAYQFARKYNIAQTGGSDAHSCLEIGRAYTIADVEDLEGLRKAIKNKKTQAFGSKSSAWVHAISTFAKIKKI